MVPAVLLLEKKSSGALPKVGGIYKHKKTRAALNVSCIPVQKKEAIYIQIHDLV